MKFNEAIMNIIILSAFLSFLQIPYVLACGDQPAKEGITYRCGPSGNATLGNLMIETLEDAVGGELTLRWDDDYQPQLIRDIAFSKDKDADTYSLSFTDHKGEKFTRKVKPDPENEDILIYYGDDNKEFRVDGIIEDDPKRGTKLVAGIDRPFHRATSCQWGGTPMIKQIVTKEMIKDLPKDAPKDSIRRGLGEGLFLCDGVYSCEKKDGTSEMSRAMCLGRQTRGGGYRCPDVVACASSAAIADIVDNAAEVKIINDADVTVPRTKSK